MNKRILSVLICLAMLISSFSVLTYAADIVIDLGPLFEDEEPAKPDDGKTDDDKAEDNKDDDKPEDKKDDDSKKDDDKSGTTTPSKDDKKDDEKPDVTTPDTTGTWKDNPFTDVKSTDWFYATVQNVTENKLFNGITATTFEPNSPLTRGMLVTILYRVAGSPAVTSASNFSDVKTDAWYGSAVIWASENGIVTGYEDGTFKPGANITREQIATIIYRYASTNGYDVSAGETTNIVSFYSDSMSVSSYATKALRYTVGTGIMKGKTETTLNPQDNATRAEAATVITRLLALA